MKTPQQTQDNEPSSRAPSPLNLWCLLRSLFARRDESGQALIFVTLMLVPMILILALGVDLGVAYGEKRQLQNVADNGSKAGTQLMEKRLRAGLTPTDGEVVAAIADVATNSSGGLTGVGGCGTGGLGTGIQAFYITRDKAVVGTVGSGGAVPSSAWGVQLVPCKKVPTSFARVVGINDIDVGAVGAWAIGVVTAVNSENGAYGPFAIWYGEVHKHYNSGNPKTPVQQCIDAAAGDPLKEFGCIAKGSTVIYRYNGWGDCPKDPAANGTVLSASTCTDTPSIWSAGNNNFKGDINHGNGWVPTGTDVTPATIVTNGGNALGQYVDRLEYAYTHNTPMLMPLIVEGEKVGGEIRLQTIGFACVDVHALPNSASNPYFATIRAIGADFEEDEACNALLQNVQVGGTTITTTSITVTEMVQ